MKVLVIGSGGREHAIVWRLAKSPLVKKLYAAPGNPGMAMLAECLAPSSMQPEVLLDAAETIDADLTVVGPEAPLVAGIVDCFQKAGRRIIGPTQAAARLEGSKIFAKKTMQRFGVPTAACITAESYNEAREALSKFSYPLVLKADGLAAGKGVVIVGNRQDAEQTLEAMFSGALVGEAGSRVVIEEFLQGEEVSFIVLSDGRHVLPLLPTQDHKAVFDGDRGPNTGGMGAYCDSRILSSKQVEQILEQVIMPVIEGMNQEGSPYKGFLYAGLMMTADGPKVLEFNVRLGDPETQPLLHALDCDLAEALLAAAGGELGSVRLAWRPEPSVCVVLAAEGYPAKPSTGDLITGIEAAEATGATVFQAGTRKTPDGLLTAGGRVLGVTASGPDLPTAIEKTYEAVRKINFRGMHYRRDIGSKGLKRWAATIQ